LSGGVENSRVSSRSLVMELTVVVGEGRGGGMMGVTVITGPSPVFLLVLTMSDFFFLLGGAIGKASGAELSAVGGDRGVVLDTISGTRSGFNTTSSSSPSSSTLRGSGSSFSTNRPAGLFTPNIWSR